MKRLVLVAMMAAAMAVAPRAAEAAILQIQVSGLNLVYTGDSTGGTACDAVSCAGGGGLTATADPVVTMNFFVDSVLVGTLSSNIWVDMFLTIGTGLETDGSPASPITGGFFDLLTNVGGWGLALDVSGGGVSYTSAGALFSFNGVTSGSIFAQALPFGLVIGEPILVTFSSNGIGTSTESGGFVTSLSADGTPDVTGVAVVPEPGSLLLLGTGLLFAASRLRRRLS